MTYLEYSNSGVRVEIDGNVAKKKKLISKMKNGSSAAKKYGVWFI